MNIFHMTTKRNIIVFTDGGSRGNPGPAATGVVLYDAQMNVLKKAGEYIGETTNNEAEYAALLKALKMVKALVGKDHAKETKIEVRADSELMVRQMRGEYKIENRRIQELFLAIWNLRVEFGGVEFVNIPRERNKEADSLVNEALDERGSQKSLV